MTAEEEQRVCALLTGAAWVFAKTMPQNPHEYTLRKKWASDADFVWLVEMIRKHGYTEMFGGKPYIQLNANGFKHWTMGNPIEETTLINRKPVGRL